MAGVKLTQEVIDQLVAKLNYYKYQVLWQPRSGGEPVNLGPLNSPPKVEPDTETKDTTLYETGSDPQASILSKNNANITIDTNNIEWALNALKNIKKGYNMLKYENGGELTFIPITEESTAKAITFPNCYLQPGLSTNFAEGDDPNYVSVSFVAKPTAMSEDGENGGELYTYEA